jgi:hypothetical protein
MRATGRIARAALGLALSAYGGVAAPQIPEQFRVVRHDLVVDVPRREAVFNLWFSEAPDLATFDRAGRQSHGFQFYLESPERRNFNRRSTGSPELVYPFVIARSGEVETGARAIARVVTAGAPNWGPIAATADIQQLGPRVTFRLPLSIFDDGTRKPYENNEWFAVHYFLDAFRFGATTYDSARGVATVGTIEAPLEVQRRELRNGKGSKRRVMIAHLLADPATEEDPVTTFLPEFVDVASVRFGPNRARPLGNELKDVNGDGHDDLVLMFNAAEVGLSCIDKDVLLTGETPQPGSFVPEGLVFIGRAVLSPNSC